LGYTFGIGCAYFHQQISLGYWFRYAARIGQQHQRANLAISWRVSHCQHPVSYSYKQYWMLGQHPFNGQVTSTSVQSYPHQRICCTDSTESGRVSRNRLIADSRVCATRMRENLLGNSMGSVIMSNPRLSNCRWTAHRPRCRLLMCVFKMIIQQCDIGSNCIPRL
jgi:hypothetical protein